MLSKWTALALLLLLVALNFATWLIFDDIQKGRLEELKRLITHDNSVKGENSVDNPNQGSVYCLPVNEEFVEKYKKQAVERNKYVNKEVDRDLYNILAPEAICPRIRIGRIFDGGKWMCDPINLPDGCVIFSLGIKGQPSFDEDIQQYTNMRCKIYGYDMYAGRISSETFKSINGFSRAVKISNVTDKEQNTSTIQDLMILEKVEKLEILKIDIEGAEYQVMSQFLEKNIVCQILIEVHNSEHDNIKKLLRDIARFDYLLFNFEINPFAVFTATEFSFIHKSCMERYFATELARYLP